MDDGTMKRYRTASLTLSALALLAVAAPSDGEADGSPPRRRAGAHRRRAL